MAFLQPVIQRSTDQRVYEFGQPNEPIGQAWKAVTALPSGARIAWFANSPQEYYPLFGRHLNLIPVPLNQDGTPSGRLHTLFAESGGAIPWWGGEPEPIPAVFLENLKRAHVDFVLVSRWHGPAWPARYWLDQGRGSPHTRMDTQLCGRHLARRRSERIQVRVTALTPHVPFLA